ncbi:MAG: maltose alpha-D-glucosyltransferase [Chloroflexota bacterium]
MSERDKYLGGDPLWYKDAIIYELHVKSFYDSDGDGVGDFRGLTEKLDYLEGLGVTAVWLLPFYPSPLRDDGYDISHYTSVHPRYGTLKDVREFLRQAHRRGIRVITELVLNHTSDQHEWFRNSRTAAPGTRWRDFYVWSTTPERYADARIIFKDFETSNWAWDPVAKAYYWHRFYSHQPDLNYDNPRVERMMWKVLDYWMEMGVDGFRLDAVPYLFEREGTNCENLRETYEALRRLRAHVDEKFKHRMLLAEANQWPEDAVSYFGNGDSCHMAFHFPLMPRMFMSLQMEDRFPIVDILDQTPPIPEACQWALFLRNHDELTLEMVTDEERDYMYRVYAKDPTARINLGIRRRLAPLIGNHRRKTELMNVLLFSLPGTPVIYYGDEIGMGDNYYLGDRDGVRTPMQWSADRNAGFSRANPQRLYLPVIIDPEYHYEALNVDNQERNPSSLLWWMKRVIALRKRFKAFSRGTTKFVQSSNSKVLAFVREYGDETVLVVVNLSRFSQVAHLDLSKYAGSVPEEMVSQNRFPRIRSAPYTLTLGFHDYFWFLLHKEEEAIRMGDFLRVVPELAVSGHWGRVFREKTRDALERDILPDFVSGFRWFAGKARRIVRVRILQAVPTGAPESSPYLLFLQVSYIEGSPEVYLVPLSFSTGEKAADIIENRPHAVVGRLHCGSGEGILFDGTYDEEFRDVLLQIISKRKAIKGPWGTLSGQQGKKFKTLAKDVSPAPRSEVLKVEQSNTAMVYNKSLFLKLYRKVEEGVNPDTEMARFLTDEADFPHTPPYAGAIEYTHPGSAPVVLAQLQRFVPNQGDAWILTLDTVKRYYETILSRKGEIKEVPRVPSSISEIAFSKTPELLQEMIGGSYFNMADLLGTRTAEMHLTLASATHPDFAPESFSVLYQRSIYQSMQSTTKRVFELLRGNLDRLPGEMGKEGKEVLGLEDEILRRFNALLGRKISAMKTRIHGDYHLGQVLWTGNDFLIIDFEGEPSRALSERRLKRSPLRDVAGMIRSFHYAPYHVLLKQALLKPNELCELCTWADLWYVYVSGVFLRSYFKSAGDAQFIPKEREDTELLLRLYVLEKAIYELGYELNNRPDWTIIPIRGIMRIMKRSPGQGR